MARLERRPQPRFSPEETDAIWITMVVILSLIAFIFFSFVYITQISQGL